MLIGVSFFFFFLSGGGVNCDGMGEGGLMGIFTGWAKLMEWKYPSVEVVVTNKKLFRTAGVVGAAASL